MNNTSREGWGRENYFANYQSGFYPHFYSRYGYYYGYNPLPICGYGFGQVGYGLGYTYGGYGGNGYIGPYSSPRNSWNGQGMMSARHIPVPYARASTPEPVNMGTGGYVGVTAAGYLRDEWSSNGKDGTNLQLTQPENRKGLEDETVKVEGG
ncbi:hypothetical protein HPP92_026423 [Vanilla planifolia]|uniref:Uncharacterized protein n=1 Tax=Vanilla planifolia TaxID=51239 RepID=A0A835UVC9_VANPL|nr:hypothetical protein HPP92_026423 [Vanilla planifolia]KAG0473845.1 hypothetical protein HPP92_015702 [Vanilla planifolia]